MSDILQVYRGYRKSFEDDGLVSSLRHLRESEQARKNPNTVDEVEFSNLLRDVQVLIDAKKKKEALMALVVARLRLNDLKVSVKTRERFEQDFGRLRAEIDAL